jgi:hypothetical protein
VQEAVFVTDLRGWSFADGSTRVRFRIGRAANPALEVEAPTLEEAIIRAGKEMAARIALAENEIEIEAEPG